MSFNSSRYRGLVKGLTAGFGSLLIGSLGVTGAIAQISPPDRELPPLTLREILERLNNRPVEPVAAPTVTEPVAAPSADPDLSDPDLADPDLSDPDLQVPEASTLPAPTEAAVEQAVSLRLDLSDRKVYVQQGETVAASFPVAIGKAGWETPTGEFTVFEQIVEPGWTSPFDGAVVPPGPGGPLGDRWIGFWSDGTDVIGFHGTPNRESVGTAASHGCVRMYNEDIRQMFDMVAMGTPVTVEP